MKEIYSTLNSLIKANQSGVVGTVISAQSGCPAGTKFVVDALGSYRLGDIPNAVFNLLQEDIKSVITAQTPRVVEKSWRDGLVKVFLDPIYPVTRLLIFGGGHIAQPLVTIGNLLELEVTVVDDRPSFANEVRFPQVTHIVCQDFQTAIREMVFDANTYVVIVTRGHRHDKTCLAEVLKAARTAYIGMIGSRHKAKAVFADLVNEGFSQEQLASVYAPIGLDIGAQSPEEIAVSIMAEIIMVKRYGYSEGLKKIRREP